MSGTCLQTTDPRSDESELSSDERPDAEQPPVAHDEPRPGARVRSLGVLETRPLTDREREIAYASILWRAMHGGC